MSHAELDPPKPGEDGSTQFSTNRADQSEFERKVPMTKMLMYLFIGSLTMMFGALALIYILRGGEKLSYPFTVPESLWFSTVFMLLSSITMHLGLLKLKLGAVRRFEWMMWVTLMLGFLFLAAQCFAWSQVYQTVTSSAPAPIRNLFYVLTGVHAAHLFGGLAWIAVVGWRARLSAYSSENRVGPELCAIYWHFLDASWMVFFAVLMFR